MYSLPALEYSDELADFPITNPLGAPHIIAQSFNEETDDSTLRAADGVATYFHRYHPDALKPFFDLKRVKFEYIARQGECFDDIFIGRIGTVVTVGYMGHDRIWAPRFTFKIEQPSLKFVPTSYIDGVIGQQSDDPSTIDCAAIKFSMCLILMGPAGLISTELSYTKFPGEEGYGETDK